MKRRPIKGHKDSFFALELEAKETKSKFTLTGDVLCLGKEYKVKGEFQKKEGLLVLLLDDGSLFAKTPETEEQPKTTPVAHLAQIEDGELIVLASVPFCWKHPPSDDPLANVIVPPDNYKGEKLICDECQARLDGRI